MTKAARGSFSFLGVCGFLAAGFALASVTLASCGGSSGGSRTGTGGTGGKGGATGTGGGSGGSTGTGGATGTGGSSGDASTSLSCSTPTTLSSPLLSDFSATTWRPASGHWGAVGNLTGSLFAYQGGNATGNNWPSMPTVANEMLTVSGTVAGGNYAGIGMAFDTCVNTTTYTGIQFTLGGDVGGCSVQLQVQTFEQQPTTNKGGCTASCYHFPNLTLATSSGVLTVHWADLAGGMPTDPTAIAAELLGLQWQMVTNAPSDAGAPPDGGTGQLPCTVTNFSVDDVTFVTN